MTRQQIVQDILARPLNILAIEPDCVSLCQAHWDAYNALWSLLNEERMAQAYDSFMEGPWSDEELEAHLRQISDFWAFKG